MPIYEYRCDACGHQQEVIQKFNADPLTECPACAEHALRKLVSAAAFHLKGSGWYQTDFKDGNKKQPEAKEGSQNGEQKSKKDGDKPASDQKTAKPEKSTGAETKSAATPSSASS